MATYLYLLLVNPKPGREQEWDDWHTHRHVVDILKVPVFVSCKRFRAAPQQRNDQAARWQFLALYEMETDDPNAVFEEVGRQIASGAMAMSDASDPSDT